MSRFRWISSYGGHQVVTSCLLLSALIWSVLVKMKSCCDQARPTVGALSSAQCRLCVLWLVRKSLRKCLCLHSCNLPWLANQNKGVQFLANELQSLSQAPFAYFYFDFLSDFSSIQLMTTKKVINWGNNCLDVSTKLSSLCFAIYKIAFKFDVYCKRMILFDLWRVNIWLIV